MEERDNQVSDSLLSVFKISPKVWDFFSPCRIFSCNNEKHSLASQDIRKKELNVFINYNPISFPSKKTNFRSQYENHLSFWKWRTAHLINKMNENVKTVSMVGEYIRMKATHLFSVWLYAYISYVFKSIITGH